MGLDKPREGNGQEPAYVRGQRTWGRAVVDAIRAGRHPSNRNGGGSFTPERLEWEMPHAFRGYFKNREELSASQPLVIQAGRVVTASGIVDVAEFEVSMPANGDLYVYLACTLDGTPGVTTGTSASLPDFTDDYDNYLVTLGILEEVFTGVWSWKQWHQGDVYLQHQTGQLFAVELTQTGGSAGDASTKCSFTYTVKDLAGNTLGTGKTPNYDRPALGKMVAATYGTAYWTTAGAVVLHSADEVPAVVACTTTTTTTTA